MTSDNPIDTSALIKAASWGRRVVALGPLATAARYDAGGWIHVELNNGCAFVFPIGLAQGLSGAKVADLRKIKIQSSGLGLYWPKLDVDLYVPSLMKGIFGTKQWMAQIGAAGDQVKNR